MIQIRIICMLAALSVLWLLVGCSSTFDSSQPVVAVDLSPYFTRTPGITPTQIIPATQTVAPTLTPFVYTIARNDTLSGIAQRYGVSLEALQAANPGIIPASLAVGRTLIIPDPDGSAVQVVLSTPVPLDLRPGICKPSGSGVDCLIPIHNPYPYALENIKVIVALNDESGQVLSSQEAILPINVLASDQTLPAEAFFSGLQSWTGIQTLLVSSTRLDDGDPRYIKTVVKNLLISINWDRLSANVQGQISLDETQKPAGSLWVVAVAYDTDDQIAGYRRWEWKGELPSDAAQPFSFPVYSLGSIIQRVEVLVEARP